MSKLHFSRTVPFSPEQMLALVADVKNYPKFVPNCSAMDVKPSEQEPDRVCKATMHIKFGPIYQHYTSRVTIDPVRFTVYSRALDGPFSHLVSQWKFVPDGKGTKVYLDIDFEVSNPFVRAVLDPAFASKQGEILDAFIVEAKRRYG